MRTQRHVGAALALVLAMALASCSGTDTAQGGATSEEPATPPSSQPADTDAAAGGQSVERLRLAATKGSGYPQPFAWVRGPGWIHAGYIFDTLLWEDSTGEPIPWLASDWEQSEDGLQWTFTIHEDATWHDGEPVTADDVVFTHAYMTEGAGADVAGFAASGLRLVSDVAAEDERTVVFTLARPAASFVEDVAQSVLIVPEHVWEDVSDPQELRSSEATIGSGPYTIDQFDESSGAARYVANDSYHLGTPVVGALEFLPVEDELTALQRGELDAAVAGTEDPVPQEQLEALEADPRIERLDTPGDWNRVLHFNMDAGFPYDDVRFRQAIAHGIDRQDLVDRIMFGRGVPGSTGTLAPSHEYVADDLPTYDHDVERAATLLDELGLVDADGDGFRDMPDGSPWEQELKASTRFSPQTPELIAEHLREVGVRVRVNVQEQAVNDEDGGSGNYTMTLAGYGGIAGDPGRLAESFHSQATARGQSSVHGFSNARFDELADEQVEAVDPEQRAPMIEEMQQIIAEQVPVLPLYVPDDSLFYDAEVFDAYYGTPGCSPCGSTRNKHMFVTGRTEGFAS